MITCTDIQHKILSSQSLSQDEQEHLLFCKDCQDFSEIHDAVLHPLDLQPSETLDHAVLAAFRESRADRKLILRPWWLAAAAAVLILLLSLAPRLKSSVPSAFSLSLNEAAILDYSIQEDDLDDLEMNLASLVMDKKADSSHAIRSYSDLSNALNALELDLYYEL